MRLQLKVLATEAHNGTNAKGDYHMVKLTLVDNCPTGEQRCGNPFEMSLDKGDMDLEASLLADKPIMVDVSQIKNGFRAGSPVELRGRIVRSAK